MFGYCDEEYKKDEENYCPPILMSCINSFNADREKEKENETIVKRNNGLITDISRKGKSTICRCAHGKEWDEGDFFEEEGGKACRICCQAN